MICYSSVKSDRPVVHSATYWTGDTISQPHFFPSANWVNRTTNLKGPSLRSTEVLKMVHNMHKHKRGIPVELFLLILSLSCQILEWHILSLQTNYFLLSMQILSGKWNWDFRLYWLHFILSSSCGCKRSFELE